MESNEGSKAGKDYLGMNGHATSDCCQSKNPMKKPPQNGLAVVVQRWKSEPPKLISLWDMISESLPLSHCLIDLECYLALCQVASREPDKTAKMSNLPMCFVVNEAMDSPRKNRDITQTHLTVFSTFLGRLFLECEKFQLSESKNQIAVIDSVLASALARCHFENTPCSYIEMATRFETLQGTLKRELKEIRFLAVQPAKAQFFSQKDLLGNSVSKAFPDAANDIIEAGNCLALGLNTAAVFHFMRAVEFSMRALAHDCGVKVVGKKKRIPIAAATWDQVIWRIEEKIGKRLGQKAPLSTAPRPQVKRRKSRVQTEKDKVFYRGILHEFLAFKDVWRNHVMHTHGDYDEHAAMHVYVHVRSFMERLATKIKEPK